MVKVRLLRQGGHAAAPTSHAAPTTTRAPAPQGGVPPQPTPAPAESSRSGAAAPGVAQFEVGGAARRRGAGVDSPCTLDVVDGRVTLRGFTIVTQAHGVQKIRGAKVQIN